MSDQTIFGSAPATPAAPQSQPADYNQLLAMIVNENGEQKYKTAEEALKGAAHAQAYIGKLLADKAALEAQVASAQSATSKQAELERTLNELLAKQSQPPASAAPAAPQFDADAIAKLVEERLAATNAANVAKQNQEAVAAKLIEAFGQEAESKYNAVAESLGLSVADLNGMAAKSPQLVLKALGVGEPKAAQPTFAPAGSAVNTAAFQPNKETFIKRNENALKIGATTQDLMEENRRAASLVNELHAAGGSINDLTDPKVFFKFFK